MKKVTYLLALLLLIALTACSSASSQSSAPAPAETAARRNYRPPRQIRDVREQLAPANESDTEAVGDSAVRAADTPESPTVSAPLPPSPSEIIAPPASGQRIDPLRPMVALTFDDGPSIHTETILDLLERYGGRATFFVIETRITRHRDTILRAHESGHEILGHSISHRNLSNLSESEIRREILTPHTAIEELLGQPVAPIFRPPFGAHSPRVRTVAGREGFAIFNWSLDTHDWRSRCAAAVHEAVMNRVRDRDIILAHDIHASTAEAMLTVIPELVARGYQLVTLSELMHHSPQTVEAGVIFTHGR
jgi:peptidoglycan/xylan/chitin deacetylase (PgdA/CDA1 family)